MKFFSNNATKKEKAIFWCISALFMIYAISLISPFVYAFISSLNDRDSFLQDFSSLPTFPHIENYWNAFNDFNVSGYNLLGMFANSVVYTVLATFLSVFMCAITAYCIAKYKFVGRNVLYAISIVIMIIPTIGSTPSMYKLVADLQFNNKVYLVPILYASGFGTNFLLLYSFFVGISWSYAEAAEIDGCNNFDIFFRIMLPQAKPSLIAVSIITAIGVWNDYMTPFLYLEYAPTLSYGLYYFNIEVQFTYNYPVLFAVILMSCFPLIVIFIAFQKTILENTSVGGLKG